MSCGLSREEVQAYHRDGMCAVVNGRCKNPLFDGSGICDMPLAAHPQQPQDGGGSLSEVTSLLKNLSTRIEGIETKLETNDKKISNTRIDQIPTASLWLHAFDTNRNPVRGNAVAVSSDYAITALHGHIALGAVVELVDIHGLKRRASVIVANFVEMEADMSLLQLITGETPFEHYIPICRVPVYLGQEIAVIGLVSNFKDDATLSFETCKVTLINSGALFHSNYVGREGLSGSAVIVSLGSTGYHVVGVHVGTHDDTASPPPINKTRKGGHASAEEAADSASSLASSLHGHMAYCLICEVARMPDIMAAL